MRVIAIIGVVAMVLLALAFSFCHAMVGFDHNENMYVTAGVLISQGKSVYHDFAYLQMPYLAELYGQVFRVTGSAHHVLVARVLTWLFWVMGAALLGDIVCRISRDRFFALGVMLLYAFNPSMLRITIESSNYVLPALLALAQVGMILLAMQSRRDLSRLAWLFFAGVAAGLSVGTKLNFLAAVAPFFLLPLFYETMRGRRIGAFVTMAAGFALALAPAALLLARDPHVFCFDNLWFHRLVTQKDLADHVKLPMTLRDKLWYARNHFVAVFSTLTIGVMILAALGLAWWNRARLGRKSIVWAATTAGGVLLTMLAVMYMTPIWPQYFAMPVPYLLLFIGCLLPVVPRGQRIYFTAFVWIAVVATAVTTMDLHHQRFDRLEEVRSVRNIHQDWAPLAIESTAAEIRDQMQSAGVSGKVATLQPLFAIEAGLPVYREFATGPFLYDIGDMISEADRKRVIGTSAASLASLLDSDPPAAILVGLYAGWKTEQPLEEYALKRGYRPVRLEARNFPSLYFDPKSAGAAVPPIYDESKSPKKKDYAILYLRTLGR